MVRVLVRHHQEGGEGGVQVAGSDGICRGRAPQPQPYLLCCLRRLRGATDAILCKVTNLMLAARGRAGSVGLLLDTTYVDMHMLCTHCCRWEGKKGAEM